MVEAEAAFYTLEDVMQLAEALVRFVVLPEGANALVAQLLFMLEYNIRASSVLGRSPSAAIVSSRFEASSDDARRSARCDA